MELFVKKTDVRTEDKSISEVHRILESSGIEWHAIDCINWNSHMYKPLAEFRIMHSEDEILLEFHIRKEGARAVYDYDAGSKPYTDDCTEFFLIPSTRDSSYFNLEMNCIGHGTFNWGPDRKTRWHGDDSIISRIRRESTLGDKAFGEKTGSQEWTLTIAVPKDLYAQRDPELEAFSGRTVKANFYKCGDDTAVPHFLSWNPIGTPTPQFHAPEYFGDLIFE